MKHLRLAGFLLALTVAGCSTTPKKLTPTCIGRVCFKSDANARIKNIVWGQDKLGAYLKEITWVPGDFKNGRLIQGHFEFQFVSESQGSLE